MNAHIALHTLAHKTAQHAAGLPVFLDDGDGIPQFGQNDAGTQAADAGADYENLVAGIRGWMHVAPDWIVDLLDSVMVEIRIYNIWTCAATLKK